MKNDKKLKECCVKVKFGNRYPRYPLLTSEQSALSFTQVLTDVCWWKSKVARRTMWRDKEYTVWIINIANHLGKVSKMGGGRGGGRERERILFPLVHSSNVCNSQDPGPPFLTCVAALPICHHLFLPGAWARMWTRSKGRAGLDPGTLTWDIES